MKIKDAFYDYMDEVFVIQYEDGSEVKVDYTPEANDMDDTIKGLIDGTLKPWW